MEDHEPTRYDRKKHLMRTLLAYLVWLAVSALAVIGLFVARACRLAVMGAAGMNRWTAGFLDKALLILCAIGTMALVIALESYFVHGSRNGTLARRILRVAGVELLVIGILQFTMDAAAGSLGSFPLGVALEAGAFVGGAVMLVLSLFIGRGRRTGA